MTAKEFYEQEMYGKPAVESCFANTVGITYSNDTVQHWWIIYQIYSVIFIGILLTRLF